MALRLAWSLHCRYGFYEAVTRRESNNAYPTPSALNVPWTSFTLRTSVFVGGRADQSTDYHFRGTVAGLAVIGVPRCIVLSRVVWFRLGEGEPRFHAQATKHVMALYLKKILSYEY